MKVILLQNVSKLGQKGEVKNVSDGYASSFLIPRGLAKFASSEQIKKVENRNKEKKQKQETIEKTSKALLKKISDSKISLKESANENGHLFAQVHLKEIADAISVQLGQEISEDWINLSEPIKEVGEFNINLEAYGNKSKIKLFIESK